MSENIAVENKDKFQVIFSYKIATSLVADYPYFNDLISIQQSKKYPNRRVWIFARSSAFDEVFEELKINAIKNREQRKKESDDFEKDCTNIGSANGI